MIDKERKVQAMKQRRPVKRGPWYWYVDGYDPEMEHVFINRGTGCSDRMCGAEDCLTCFPNAGYDDDEEEE